MATGPVGGRRIKRRTQRNLFIGVIVVLALVLVIGGGSYMQSSLSESAARASAEAVEQTKRELIQTANQQIDPIRRQLKGLADDAGIITAFVSSDTESLLALEKEKLAAFDNGLKLRLLLPGEYQLQQDVIPPLGYASLDVLGSVEDSKVASKWEVHGFGTDDEHILAVQPVLDAEQNLVGLLHLSLSVDFLTGLINSVAVDNAYLELVQVSGGVKLASKGDTAFQSANNINVIIPGTTWKFVHRSGKAQSADASGSSLGSLLPIIIVVVILAACAFLYFKFKGSPLSKEKPQEEGVVYQGAIKAIMDGAHPGAENLIPDLPTSRSSSMSDKKSSNIPDISLGYEGDDATQITNPAAAAKPAEAAAPAAADVEISPKIFRAYDIRGIVTEDFTAEVVEKIGQAIGSEATARGERGIAVGRDGRSHGPELSQALIKGIRASGQDVIDIGMVPTPVLYYATNHLELKSGVMLTGSHNPPEYNGMKIVIGGSTLSGDDITGLRERIVSGNLESGSGGLQEMDINSDYVRRISEDIPVSLSNSFKIVVDAGNGVAGALAPQLYRALGHDVVEIFCEVDGNFPNHHPDPSQPENLEDLINKVKEEGADLGFAFDGDGDRLGVVDSEGNIIWPDRQLMLLAKDVLSRNAGAEIIFDVKCSRYLKSIIESCGGKPLMWKTGHSLVKAKMKETGSPLAGEMSGHIFFKERWYGFDDALYTGARMLEVLCKSDQSPDEVFMMLPEGISTPELRAKLDESEHQSFMQELKKKSDFEGAEISDVDGLRADFDDGWGLVRPSNTSPYLVLRFEAESEEALERIKTSFREQILAVNPALDLPF